MWVSDCVSECMWVSAREWVSGGFTRCLHLRPPSGQEGKGQISNIKFNVTIKFKIGLHKNLTTRSNRTCFLFQIWSSNLNLYFGKPLLSDLTFDLSLVYVSISLVANIWGHGLWPVAVVLYHHPSSPIPYCSFRVTHYCRLQYMSVKGRGNGMTNWTDRWWRVHQMLCFIRNLKPGRWMTQKNIMALSAHVTDTAHRSNGSGVTYRGIHGSQMLCLCRNVAWYEMLVSEVGSHTFLATGTPFIIKLPLRGHTDLKRTHMVYAQRIPYWSEVTFRPAKTSA